MRLYLDGEGFPQGVSKHRLPSSCAPAERGGSHVHEYHICPTIGRLEPLYGHWKLCEPHGGDIVPDIAVKMSAGPGPYLGGETSIKVGPCGSDIWRERGEFLPAPVSFSEPHTRAASKITKPHPTSHETKTLPLSSPLCLFAGWLAGANPPAVFGLDRRPYIVDGTPSPGKGGKQQDGGGRWRETGGEREESGCINLLS